MSSQSGSVVGVDVGGTFTDTVLVQPGEPAVAVKVPTTEPATHGVIESIRLACERSGIDPETVEAFSHGSTVATNALLERNGATTALVTTDGFRDVLEIGRQDRERLYDLSATRAEPLVSRERRFEVSERTPPPTHPDPDRIRTPPDPAKLDTLIDELEDVNAVAISFLHADVDPAHEQQVAEVLDEALEIPIITSSDIDPTVREFERTATTVASAYLTPVLAEYLDHLVSATEAEQLPQPLVMQSNGGVATIDKVTERAVTSVLSGPAAGVVGATEAVETHPNLTAPGYITLDMGGTSADVCLIEDGQFEQTTETTIGGVPIRVPAVDVHTVGAGGGSIAWVDEGGALRVGPSSAGASPGPACYDRGGTEPTVTDAAVVLGIIGADRALGRHVDIAEDRAFEVISQLADDAKLASPRAAAAGVFRVATETMTQAIRHITVERGHDPRDDGLIAFGGAGGMHATAIADRLDIDTVVIPPRAGLLSAAGLVGADERHDTAQGCHKRLHPDNQAELQDIFETLEDTATARASDPEATSIYRSADLRYQGQSYELTVDVDDPMDVTATGNRFEAQHQSRRGYTLDDHIDVIACRVEVVVPTEVTVMQRRQLSGERQTTRSVTVPPADETSFEVFDGVPPAEAVDGPSIIELPNTTVVIPSGWELLESAPLMILTRKGEQQ